MAAQAQAQVAAQETSRPLQGGPAPGPVASPMAIGQPISPQQPVAPAEPLAAA